MTEYCFKCTSIYAQRPHVVRKEDCSKVLAELSEAITYESC